MLKELKNKECKVIDQILSLKAIILESEDNILKLKAISCLIFLFTCQCSASSAQSFGFHLLDVDCIDCYLMILKSNENIESLLLIVKLFHHLIFCTEPNKEEAENIENSGILETIIDQYLKHIVDYINNDLTDVSPSTNNRFSKEDSCSDNETVKLFNIRNLTGYTCMLFGNYIHCEYSLINKVVESNILSAFCFIIENSSIIENAIENTEFDYANNKILSAMRKMSINGYESEVSKISLYYAAQCHEIMLNIEDNYQRKEDISQRCILWDELYRKAWCFIYSIELNFNFIEYLAQIDGALDLVVSLIETCIKDKQENTNLNHANDEFPEEDKRVSILVRIIGDCASSENKSLTNKLKIDCVINSLIFLLQIVPLQKELVWILTNISINDEESKKCVCSNREIIDKILAIIKYTNNSSIKSESIILLIEIIKHSLFFPEIYNYLCDNNIVELLTDILSNKAEDDRNKCEAIFALSHLFSFPSDPEDSTESTQTENEQLNKFCEIGGEDAVICLLDHPNEDFRMILNEFKESFGICQNDEESIKELSSNL